MMKTNTKVHAVLVLFIGFVLLVLLAAAYSYKTGRDIQFVTETQARIIDSLLKHDMDRKLEVEFLRASDYSNSASLQCTIAVMKKTHPKFIKGVCDKARDYAADARKKMKDYDKAMGQAENQKGEV